MYEALTRRSPKSRGVPSGPGRRGAPAEVVLRLLLLKHIRNWSYGAPFCEGEPKVVRRETRNNPALDEYWVVAVRVQRV